MLKKISYVILIAIIIAGGVMVGIKGFNKDIPYKDNATIYVSVGKEFSIKEMRDIAKEVFGNQRVLVQVVELYKDMVSFTVEEKSDEELAPKVEELNKKINEKYGKEIKAEETTINTVPRMHLRDLANQYKSPFIIATICILVYMMIRYYRLKSLKVFIKTVAVVVIAQLELFAIIAITRIPIGRLTIPMVLTVYMLSLIGCTTYFEKQLEIKKQEK